MTYHKETASLLSALTKKDQLERVKWTRETKQVFLQLQEALTSHPVLRNHDFSLPFTLHTDASETGLRAIMSQEFDREEHLVLFISRKLTPAEKNYSVVE